MIFDNTDSGAGADSQWARGDGSVKRSGRTDDRMAKNPKTSITILKRGKKSKDSLRKSSEKRKDSTLSKKSQSGKNKGKGKDKEKKTSKFEKQLGQILDIINTQDVLVCLFYIITTLVAVLAAFLFTGGAMTFLMTLALSEASEFTVEEALGFKFLVVTGTKLFSIVACSVGLLQCMISVLGCCGMMHHNSTTLKAFGVLYAFMAICNFCLMIYLSYHMFQVNADWLKDKLLDLIKIYDGKKNFQTFFIDRTQVKLGCCGIVSQKDFQTTTWHSEGHRGVPFSCCQLKKEQSVIDFDFSVPELTLQDLLVPTCPRNPAGRAFTSVPCFEKVKQVLTSAYVVGLTAAVFTFFLEIAATHIAFTTARQNKAPVIKTEVREKPLDSLDVKQSTSSILPDNPSYMSNLSSRSSRSTLQQEYN